MMPFSAHRMNQVHLGIDNNLIAQVQQVNNQFKMQQEAYESQKKSDCIKHKFMLKKKAQE